MAHWSCLAKIQRDEILRAALEKDRTEWLSSEPTDDDEEALQLWTSEEPKKRPGLENNQTTEFICGSCMKGGMCYACQEVALEADGVIKVQQGPQPATETLPSSEGDVEMADGTATSKPREPDESKEPAAPTELLYRCTVCKRLAHYAHLPPPEDDSEMEYSPTDLAIHYQLNTAWQCSDCVSLVYGVDQILAWRPHPENAVEPKRSPGEVPNYKEPLPREYLVKWTDRSYLRVQWVPHMWLAATSPAKLSNFLRSGPQVPLLPEPVADAVDDLTALNEPVSTFGVGAEEQEDAESTAKAVMEMSGTPDALPDAERRIPPAYKVVDRVLEVLLWRPEKRLGPLRKKKAKPQKRSKPMRIQSESEEEDGELQLAQLEVDEEMNRVHDLGEQPSADLTEYVADWEKRNGKKFGIGNIGLVVWGLFKWNGLNYDNGT